MAIALTYEKDGRKQRDTFYSYYEAVKKKNRLLSKGVSVNFQETKEANQPTIQGLDYLTKRRNPRKEAQFLIDNFIKNAKVSRKQSYVKKSKWDI